MKNAIVAQNRHKERAETDVAQDSVRYGVLVARDKKRRRQERKEGEKNKACV